MVTGQQKVLQRMQSLIHQYVHSNDLTLCWEVQQTYLLHNSKFGFLQKLYHTTLLNQGNLLSAIGDEEMWEAATNNLKHERWKENEQCIVGDWEVQGRKGSFLPPESLLFGQGEAVNVMPPKVCRVS